MGRLPRAVAPALAGVLGAVVGIVIALALHWHVIETSDDELLAATEVVVPAGFAPIGEPVISGAWAPSFTRGVAHVDATASTAVTLGEIAEQLRAGGWTVGDVDAFAMKGDVRAERGRLVASVSVSARDDRPATASVSVRRGPAEPSLGVAVVAVAVAGAGVGVVLTARCRRSRRHLGHR
jgi:hypothetical protein